MDVMLDLKAVEAVESSRTILKTFFHIVRPYCGSLVPVRAVAFGLKLISNEVRISQPGKLSRPPSSTIIES